MLKEWTSNCLMMNIIGLLEWVGQPHPSLMYHWQNILPDKALIELSYLSDLLWEKLDRWFEAICRHHCKERWLKVRPYKAFVFYANYGSFIWYTNWLLIVKLNEMKLNETFQRIRIRVTRHPLIINEVCFENEFDPSAVWSYLSIML